VSDSARKMEEREERMLVTLSVGELKRIVAELLDARSANTQSAWVTCREAAEVLRCTERNVINLVARGLPHTKVGRTYRFRRDQLEEWIRSRGK
jgi:excisionase family DNA binding protein